VHDTHGRRSADGPSPLAAAAMKLHNVVRRVAGDGDGTDWLAQVVAGDWDVALPAEAAEAVRERLLVVAEQFRTVRAVAGSMTSGTPGRAQPGAGVGFAAASKTRLPVNRKERYYTGTVLPALIASDGLLHLPRFLRLCGLDVGVPDDGHAGARRSPGRAAIHGVRVRRVVAAGRLEPVRGSAS